MARGITRLVQWYRVANKCMDPIEPAQQYIPGAQWHARATDQIFDYVLFQVHTVELSESWDIEKESPSLHDDFMIVHEGYKLFEAGKQDEKHECARQQRFGILVEEEWKDVEEMETRHAQPDC